MVFDSKQWYRLGVQGLLPSTEGFDGKVGWVSGISGVPHLTDRADRDLSRIVAYVIDGTWTSPKTPFTATPKGADEKGVAFELRFADSVAPAALTLDPVKLLPARLTHWGASGQAVWTFSRYQEVNGLQIPTHIEMKDGDDGERIVVQSMEFMPDSKESFRVPAVDEAEAVFDKSAPAEVEVKKVFGHLFVHPKLNGVDEGWFIFDSGADVMVLDPKITEKYAVPAIGGESTSGVVKSSMMKISQGLSFTLGPLTLKRPSYFQMDLAGIGQALRMNVVGICGYDFISRAGIDIDTVRGKMGIYPPGKAPLPKGATWQPFTFHSNIPNVKCTFEGDHSGYFNIDTGSDSAVDFCSPAVDQFKLLEGRTLVNGMTGGAGGSAASKGGPMDWFVFAGRRFEKLRMGYQLTKEGAFASPYFDGNIGMGILGRGRLVFDYRAGRMAFGQ